MQHTPRHRSLVYAILSHVDAIRHFIPDRDSAPAFHPLRGLVPLLSASVAAEYIAAYTAPGDLILDPFAISPVAARVGQAMERRVVAVESHPLWVWILRALASPPSASEIDSVLARLGDTLKDDTPLREHLDQLYTTTCANCQGATPADFFVRARGGEVLQRRYTCAHCGVTRADPATANDFQRAAQFDPRGLHFHFAFERVVPEENLYAERIRKILALYTPRNLYALVTLTQKAELLFREPRERAVIFLLLLYLLNRGASFYTDPARDAPARFAAHLEFLEFNLWRELEFAARELRQVEPLANLAETPKEVRWTGALRAFVGRSNVRTLARELPPDSVALVVAAPPISRAPVWALAYFFGAWIFGRAAMHKLVPDLDSAKDAAWERQSFIDSLTRELTAVARLVPSGARVVFAFDEARHVVSDTLLLAASHAQFQVESFVFQPRVGELPRREFEDISGEYRITLFRGEPAPRTPLAEKEVAAKIRAAALAGARDLLTRRGEALAYAWVHHAAYTRVAREGWLELAAHTKLATPPHVFGASAIREGLREGYAQDFDHYESADAFLWRLSGGKSETPLIERVEDAVREKLQNAPSIRRVELEDAIYRQFPEELTPEAGLIELCARAYADERDGVWHWRATDVHEKSRGLESLTRLGERLQFEIARDIAPFDLAWKDAGEIAHGFVWRERAQFADLASVYLESARGFVLVTAYQFPMTLEKTKRLPHLVERFYEAGWDFARVERWEAMEQREQVMREDLPLVAGLMPVEEKQQLELL